MWFHAIIRARPLNDFTAGQIKTCNSAICQKMRSTICKLSKRVSGIALMGMYSFDLFIPI